MKAKDLIKKLEDLGYDDNTTVSFGFCNYDGAWFELEIEEINDDDRECNVDDIGVIFKDNEEYKKSIFEEGNIALEEDLRMLITKYC